MLAGCGGGGSKGGGGTGSPSVQTPTTPTAPTRTQRDSFLVANGGRLADATRVQFGSVTQSSDGTTVTVTSPSRGELTFRASTGLTIDTRTRATLIGKTAIPGNEIPKVGSYTQNGTYYEIYDSSVPVLGVGFGVWNTANEFIAGGAYLTPTTSGVFFDGTRFDTSEAITTATYEGRAAGLYRFTFRGGDIAGLTGWTTPTTVQVGQWNSDVNLTATNGNVTGTLTGFSGASWGTWVNGRAAVEGDPMDLRTLTGTLQSSTSTSGRVQGSVGLSYRGVAYRTSGGWAAQSSNDGMMIGGTLNGTSVDATGRDSLGFVGAFVTERQ